MFKRVLSLVLALVLVLGAFPGITLFAEPAAAVGNKYLQENLEKFPELFKDGMTQPIFSNAADRVVIEEVYIETPLDTDFDGKRDLQRVTIRRPIETKAELGGLKTPVIASLTPYQTSMSRPTFAAFSGRVDGGFVDQGPAATKFQHTRFIDGQQIFGTDGDLSYQALRDVTAQRVGKGANAHVAQYKDLLTDGMLKATSYTEQQQADYPWLPPARVPTGTQLDGTPIASYSGSAGPWSAANYLTRGYAFAQMNVLGSDNAQGMLQYGMYQESICAAALVDWLNGRVRGFTDPTGTIEVEAYWATGEVAASGTSYGGTLPIAAAVTGVEGLRTIIPGAPVTNAYNYYRENGIPYAPGGWQGEDITSTTYYCFGRGWNLASVFQPTPAVWDTWWDWQLYLMNERDSVRGDYSPFWDERNPLSFGGDMRKDVGVIMGHGFNDDNVKFRHTALLNDMLKYNDIEVVKGIFGQAGHALNADRTGSWLMRDNNLLKWTDHYLYGVDNGVTEAAPNYYVEGNIGTAQWTAYDNWPAYTGYQKLYPTGGRVGALAEKPQTEPATLSLKDTLLPTLARPAHDYQGMADGLAANRRHILTAGTDGNGWLRQALIHQGQGSELGTGLYHQWRNMIIGGLAATTSWSGGRLSTANAALTASLDFSKDVPDRLLFNMQIPEDFTISGTVKMTADVAASKNVGVVSAMLIESGTTTKIVALGSVDVRNPNPEGTISLDVPGTANIEKGGNWHANYLFQAKDIAPYGASAPEAANFNPYTWEMDITEYKFTAGNQLSLIIFGSDPVFTYRPTDPTELAVNVGAGTYLSLPVIGYIEPAITLSYDGKIIRKGDYVTIDAAYSKPMESNTAVLDFTFDTSKFEYAGVTPASGVTILTTSPTADGVRFSVMIPDYEAKDLLSIMLRAKTDGEIIRGDNPISVVGNIVIRDENGDKEIIQLASDANLLTDDREEGEIEPGKKFTLIDLSNIIDAFGFNTKHPEWISVYRFFDYNANGSIDINDITVIAKYVTQ